MAEQSLITDKMKKAVGVSSEPVAYDIEQGLIKQFAQAIGDPNPQWQDEVKARTTPKGGIIAPPTFLRTCNPKELDELEIVIVELGKTPFGKWFLITDGGQIWKQSDSMRLNLRAKNLKGRIKMGLMGAFFFIPDGKKYGFKVKRIR